MFHSEGFNDTDTGKDIMKDRACTGIQIPLPVVQTMSCSPEKAEGKGNEGDRKDDHESQLPILCKQKDHDPDEDQKLFYDVSEPVNDEILNFSRITHDALHDIARGTFGNF